MRLLSVDWDFFFPIPEHDRLALYDWGHREDMAFMKDAIWTIRAGAFLQAGAPLPRATEYDGFWQRFRHIAPDATLYFADSHAHIFKPEVRAGVTEIWNFDAHHDSYKGPEHVYKTKAVSCEDWATGYTMIGVKVYTFFPAWKAYGVAEEQPVAPMMPKVQPDPGKPFNKPFDRVFVCRSAAWMPSWLDDDFADFLNSCPAWANRKNIDGVQRRDFNLEDARRMQAQVDETIKEAERANMGKRIS